MEKFQGKKALREKAINDVRKALGNMGVDFVIEEIRDMDLKNVFSGEYEQQYIATARELINDMIDYAIEQGKE